MLCKRRGSESFLIPSSLLSDPLLETLTASKRCDNFRSHVEQTPLEGENVSYRVTNERKWNFGGTKLSSGQLFPFLDLQDCLASLRSADNCPVDLGK